MRKKLTQDEIDGAKLSPGKQEEVFWDTGMPGFGLRLREGGSRKFIVQYGNRKMTIADAKKVSAKEARKRAKQALGTVSLGKDPQAEKDKARATDTLGATVANFLEVQKQGLRPSSFLGNKLYLEKYLKPLHSKKLNEIARFDIAGVLSPIAKRTPVSAQRARSAASAMFSWAVSEGLVEMNPVIGLTTYAEPSSRDRVLSEAELAAVWLAQREDDYGDIVRLLILTGQRRDEIADLRSIEIVKSMKAIPSLGIPAKDLSDMPAIDLPANRSKNGKSHIIPLAPAAYRIIKPRLERSYLFGRLGTGFSGWSRAKVLLDARLKLEKPWQLRDIRRSVATGMAEQGIEPHIIEAVLNHVSGHKVGVAGIYNRASYAKQKAEALTKWAHHVATIVAQATGANVTKLKKPAS